MSASGNHCDTPAAPCIWMASLMMSQHFSGTIALTALTQMRASALPSVSMALAARSTISRMASTSMRDRDTISMFLPRLMSFLPKPSRERPRSTIISMAFSAEPIERMQWWMRPGPSRSWLISKPRPSPSRMLSLGTRTSSKVMCMCPCGASSAPKTCIGPRMLTPGVSIGTRICDCCL